MTAFPDTQHSVMRRLDSQDQGERERALDRLVNLYYRPVYGHLRAKWRLVPIEAEDCTQEFFGAVAERKTFAAFRPELGRFRSFVRTCVDNHVTSEFRAQGRAKRGGGVTFTSVDTSDVEARLACGGPSDPDEIFEREWRRTLISTAIQNLRDRLRSAGRHIPLQVFERYDLVEPEDRPTYARIASDLEIRVHDVTNHLHLVRRELREIVREGVVELASSVEEATDDLVALGVAQPKGKRPARD